MLFDVYCTNDTLRKPSFCGWRVAQIESLYSLLIFSITKRLEWLYPTADLNLGKEGESRASPWGDKKLFFVAAPLLDLGWMDSYIKILPGAALSILPHGKCKVCCCCCCCYCSIHSYRILTLVKVLCWNTLENSLKLALAEDEWIFCLLRLTYTWKKTVVLVGVGWQRQLW